MSGRPAPEWFDPDSAEPEAVVKRVGRWAYHVYVSHGLMQWGPDGYGWTVLGRQRAHRKASRVLRKYKRMQERHRDVTVVSWP